MNTAPSQMAILHWWPDNIDLWSLQTLSETIFRSVCGELIATDEAREKISIESFVRLAEHVVFVLFRDEVITHSNGSSDKEETVLETRLLAISLQ